MSNKKSKMVRARHSSLEMPDPEVVVRKNKQDMLTKARTKLQNISDALKSSKNCNNDQKKTMAQATINYFFKPAKHDKNHIYANNIEENKKYPLKKQHSLGEYPIKIEISVDSEEEQLNATNISRLRPATVCVDKVTRETAALALERPRKKLSFRDPEISGYDAMGTKKHSKISNTLTPDLPRRNICNGILHRPPSYDNLELESQAMRVVRTIGQAFEVCHKLSINAPENEHDQDEQDTLTQDLLSDRLSDIISDKPKKDLMSEGASDKMSVHHDDSTFRDPYPENDKNISNKPSEVEILPPPPVTNTRKSPLQSAETYASPHSDVLTSGSGSGGSSSLPPPGSALSTHHELQLMREQLDQQSQQTQAALAQLQLAREQLAAEQSARLEAQARTHQLLIHNRELLDHIAALVSHLQGSDKSGQPTSPPHVTMPQQQQHTGLSDSYIDVNEYQMDNGPVLQTLGVNQQNLIENRAVTTCLPSSPLRTAFNPGAASVLSYPYSMQQPPQPSLDAAVSYDTQLLQRLQNITNYAPYYYGQTFSPLLTNPLFGQPLINNNNYNTLPLPKKMPSSPLPLRHSFPNPMPDQSRISPARSSEPRQIPQHYQSQQNLQQQQQQQQHQQQQQDLQNHQHLQEQRQKSQQTNKFIKPLSQMGPLTTTDAEGRMRVIVPVPSANSTDDSNLSLLSSLRISDDGSASGSRLLNGPGITRSTSEKVPNRSELMNQVQRTMWARHTTK